MCSSVAQNSLAPRVAAVYSFPDTSLLAHVKTSENVADAFTKASRATKLAGFVYEQSMSSSQFVPSREML